jgi:hypothetical protein
MLMVRAAAGVRAVSIAGRAFPQSAHAGACAASEMGKEYAYCDCGDARR